MVMIRKVIIELPVAVYEILTHQSAGLMNWISWRAEAGSETDENTWSPHWDRLVPFNFTCIFPRFRGWPSFGGVASHMALSTSHRFYVSKLSMEVPMPKVFVCCWVREVTHTQQWPLGLLHKTHCSPCETSRCQGCTFGLGSDAHPLRSTSDELAELFGAHIFNTCSFVSCFFSKKIGLLSAILYYFISCSCHVIAAMLT